MSVAPAKTWLKRQKIDDKSLMAILRGLVASIDGNVCNVPQSRLAKNIGMSERHLRRGLGALRVLGIADSCKQSVWGTRGRAADVIFVNLDLDFDVSKEAVLSAKSGTLLPGQMSGAAQAALSGQMSGAPTPLPIRKIIYADDGAELHRCVGRVHYDSSRNLWRAILTVAGVELDLGRHEAKDLAEAEIYVALTEIEFTVAHRTGNPVHPKLNPSFRTLEGEALCDFLFGSDREMGRPTGRAADRRGSGGSSPGQGCGDEVPASPSPRFLRARDQRQETTQHDSIR